MEEEEEKEEEVVVEDKKVETSGRASVSSAQVSLGINTG